MDSRSGIEVRNARAGKMVMRRLAEGEGELESGRPGCAAQSAKLILRKDPRHLGALELLARAQWRMQAYPESLETLRTLIGLNPYEPGYHFMRAVALQALGRYGEALRAFERCLTGGTDPIRASAWTAIQDLERWQEDVLAELVKADDRFRIEYTRDPSAACAAHGFAFLSGDSTNRQSFAEFAARHPVIWARPS